VWEKIQKEQKEIFAKCDWSCNDQKNK